jgi:hypothetical protein
MTPKFLCVAPETGDPMLALPFEFGNDLGVSLVLRREKNDGSRSIPTARALIRRRARR